MKRWCVLWAALLVPVLSAAEWKAGAAKVPMTPQGPLFMAGYGNRARPSEGVALELYAKALVLEDPAGTRAVLVTTDMLGFPASLSNAIADRVREKYGIPRDRLMLNSSHTHCGPVVMGMAAVPGYNMKPKDWEAVAVYTRELEDKIVAVIGTAIKQMAPARLSFGKTVAGFGVHRRMPGGKLWGPNYAGPADHDVPVLRVEAADGSLLAVAFGYGTHNSTVGIFKFHGDYAGSAQKWLEDRHPGAVAMFVMGCGGDVKAYPNQTLELVDAYGATLGAAVEQRFQRGMVPVNGDLKTHFETVPLKFAEPPTRAQFEERAKSRSPITRRHAETMLKTLDRDGRLPADYPYPVQAWQFGKDLTMVALGGEVVSEYALRLNKELGTERLWVAGYSNDEFAYIPSVRILDEGGYEADSSMEFYLLPGRWASSVEETVVGAVHQAVKRVRGE
ncbi:MAG TPA: neutral/alkaline non-lysosomal ceramidase N-terminal domain-containing protein [Bryobacteraceae bacterium]|nr:neutral/alkaline non-lysosomal ceramidase N-terminal domain-containing protein [Bryobacteraceae bacterium]